MLQVIKAEDVRDGEPRWWCPDDVYAARTLEWIVTGNLHTEWRREADAFTLAIVDRPAPTPTPAPGLDLDAVERAERAMTPGPWDAKDGFTSYPESSDGEPWSMAIAGPDRIAYFEENGRMLGDQQSRNAAGIVALRNAAPALIAEVRALRAALTEAKRLGLEACDRATHTEQCGKTQADYHHSKGYRGCPGEDEDCTCGLAAIAAALEAL